MAHPGDSPDSGWAKMYTGKPSQAGDATKERGYGLVKGDGVGLEDVADSRGTGKITKGIADGKRRKVPTELEQS